MLAPKHSTRFVTRILSIVFLTIVLLPAAAPPAQAGARPAPPWEASDVEGKTVKSSDFKGKVVILDFWATWCPPCREEIPGFVALQNKYANKGLTIVGVSLDEQGPSVVKPFMKRFAMNYPVVMGDSKLVSDYGGISAIPTTFIIDRQGNVVTAHQGYTDQATFEAEIRPLLDNGQC